MIEVIDQIGRKLSLHLPAKRVVSLVPSLTELVYDLEAHHQLVGRTKFCIYPQNLENVEKIGGTKNLNFDKIKALQPDLIIANKEENNKVDIEQLTTATNVYVSDIKSVEDCLEAISQLGELLGKSANANEIIEDINLLRNQLELRPNETCIYMIWKNPWMTIGADTFIFSMLKEAGFQSMITTTRYPEITIDQIHQLNPKYIFLSSEPYPFKEKDVQELQDICPNSKIVLVDATYFSWYGSRVRHSYAYFNKLFTQLHTKA